MKNILTVLIIFSAVMLNAYSFEQGNEITLAGHDSLFVVYDNELFSGFTAYPDKNRNIMIDIPDSVFVVSLYSYPKDLYRVYAAYRSSEIWTIMGDVFYENSMTDSSLYYYREALGININNNNAYKGLLDIAQDMGNDSLIYYMGRYTDKFRGSKAVLFENAMQYRKMGNDSMYSIMLKEGIQGNDDSESYLMLLVYALYADIEVGVDNMKYAMQHFADNENLSYVIDFAGSNNVFDELAEYIAALTESDVNAENKLSAALIMMDEDYQSDKAYSVISTLIEDSVFPEYTGYLYYKLAENDVHNELFETARINFTKARDNDTYRDKSYYFTKFSMDSFFGDSASMLRDAANVIAMNYTDSTLFKHMGPYEGYALEYGESMLSEILESEVESIPQFEFALNDLYGRTVSLDEYTGILFIDCFTSWCSYCKKAMPLIQAMQEEITDLEMIGISSEKTSEDLLTYADEKSITFPVLYNGTDVYNQLSVQGVPNMMLMDLKSRRMFRLVGYSEDLKEFFHLRYRFLKGEI